MTRQGNPGVGNSNPRRVVYGVTVGASAFSLLRGQLEWLRERGWDVHLVTSPDEFARRAAERERVRLHALPMRRNIAVSSDMKSLVGWTRLLGRMRPVVVNAGTPKAGLLGMVAAWIMRVPRRVYVLRGLRLESATSPTVLLLWLMEWLTMRAATDVVLVSDSLGKEARRRRLLPRKRCWMIGAGSSNGVDSDLVAARVAQTDPSALRTSLGIGAEDFVIGYVGRITADKGIDTLASAMSLVDNPNLRALLIGSLETDDVWIDRFGDRAVHVGWTDEVWSYYAIIDVLCLPTRREGFPNVVLEAAAAGVPTLTTDSTGAIDSVIDGVTGRIVHAGDPIALAAAITEYMREPTSVATQGANAKEHVRRNFRPEDIWQGLESILQGCPLPTVRKI